MITALRCSLLAVVLLPTVATTQQSSPPPKLPDPKAADVAVQGYVYEPAAAEPNDATLRQLRVPDGFQVGVFARDLGGARMLAVADDGTVYVTRREEGDLLLVRDRDGDGRVDEVRTVVRRPQLHGGRHQRPEDLSRDRERRLRRRPSGRRRGGRATADHR